MGLSKKVSLRSLESVQGGTAQFYTPQSSHETILVQIPPHSREDMFVHRSQTDQLLVVRGSFVLVILSNRHYEYILLSEAHPQVVTIPPGIPHGAINLSSQPCFLVNALIRHGAPHNRDYQPLTPPFPYDLAQALAIQVQAPSPLVA